MVVVMVVVMVVMVVVVSWVMIKTELSDSGEVDKYGDGSGGGWSN